MPYGTTRRYKRLPPDSGVAHATLVHAVGFEDISIPSRQTVIKEIRNFLKHCNKEAREPAARVILGEWGEGKTDIFQRYIKSEAEKKGGHGFLVAASSLGNNLVRFEEETASESRRFLSAIFETIREEYTGAPVPARGVKLLDEWLEVGLKQLTADRKERKIFMFIDEVEELIHEPEKLRHLMQGVKETLNGQFALLSDQGKYGSSLFIFLACTPEAYNQICMDPDIRQVFGGFGRRLSVINVEPVRPNEGVKFLYELLKYSYHGSLPSPLPVSTTGVFYNLVSVTRGNLGLLVSLFSRIMSKAVGSETEMQVISGDELIDFLQTQRVPFGGVETPCLEPQLLKAIEERLTIVGQGEVHANVFKLLLSEQRPFTTKEIAERITSVEKAPLVKHIIPQLEDGLKQLGYAFPLSRFLLVDKSIEFDVLWHSLENYHVDGALKIEQAPISRDEFEDRLTFLEFDSQNNLTSHLLIPADAASIRPIVGTISEQKAEELLRILISYKSSSDTDVRLLLSKEIVNQVFPPPSPPGLEFVQDKNMRLSLWREATQRFTDRYADDIPPAVTKLLSVNHKLDIIADNAFPIGRRVSVSLIDRQDPERPFSVQCLISASLGRPSQSEFDSLINDLEHDQTIHVALVVQSLDLDVSTEIEAYIDQQCSGRVLSIYVHPTFAKQMLATYWALERNLQKNDKMLTISIEKLFGRDIPLRSAMNRWYPIARNNGIMVDVMMPHSNETEFIGVLRLYLNAIAERATEEKVFEFNHRILREIVPFGSKKGLLPDVAESLERFQIVTADLKANGFLETDQEGLMRVRQTNVERQILSILARSDSIDYDRLCRCFIVRHGQERILERIYLQSLEQRGLIEITGKRTRRIVNLVDCSANARRVLEKLKGFLVELKEASKEPRYQYYAHVFISKQRQVQLITTENYVEHLNKVARTLEDCIAGGKVETAAALTVFLSLLMGDFSEILLAKTRLASIRALETVEKCDDVYAKAAQDIKSVLSRLQNLLPYDSQKLEISELVKVESLIRSVHDWEKKEFSDQELKLEGENIIQKDEEAFTYSRLFSDDALFNVRLWHVKHLSQEIENATSDISRHLEPILLSIKDQEDVLAGNRSRLLTMCVDKRCFVAKALHDLLLDKCSFKTAAFPKSPPDGQVTILDLKNDLQEPLRSLRDENARMANLIGLLEGFLQYEMEYQKEREKILVTLQRLKELVDIPELNEQVSTLLVLLEDSETQRYALISQIDFLRREPRQPSHEEVRKLEQTLEHLIRDSQDIEYAVLQKVWKPFVCRIRTAIQSAKTMLQSLKMATAKHVDTEIEHEILKCNAPDSMESFLAANKSMKSHLSDLADVTRKILILVRNHLSGEESEVWQDILSFVSEPGTWVSWRTLIDNLCKSGRDVSRVQVITESLVKKGFLQKGISLPE